MGKCTTRVVVEQLLRRAHARGLCLHLSNNAQASALRRLYRAGLLVRPLPGLYAAKDWWATLDPYARHRSLVFSLAQMHPDWAFCGPSACVVLGLECAHVALGKVHVLATPGGMTPSTSKVVRHDFSFRRLTRAAGVLVTSLEDTLEHVLRMVPLKVGLGIADSALRRTGRKRRWLQGLFSRAHKGLRGVGTARLVAAIADGTSENGGESAVRASMYELGFELPRLQVPFSDPMSGRVSRVDYCWEHSVVRSESGGRTLGTDAGLLVGELDGRQKYVDPVMTQGRTPLDVMREERLRESRLGAEGARVMRFSFAQAMDAEFFWHLLYRYGVPLSPRREEEMARLRRPVAPALPAGAPRLRLRRGWIRAADANLAFEVWAA